MHTFYDEMEEVRQDYIEKVLPHLIPNVEKLKWIIKT